MEQIISNNEPFFYNKDSEYNRLFKSSLKYNKENLFSVNFTFNDFNSDHESLIKSISYAFPTIPVSHISTICDKKNITFKECLDTLKQYKLAEKTEKRLNNTLQEITNNNNNSNNVSNSNNNPQQSSSNIGVNQLTSIFSKINIKSATKMMQRHNKKRAYNQMFKFIPRNNPENEPKTNIFESNKGPIVKDFSQIKKDILSFTEKEDLVSYMEKLLKDLEDKDNEQRIINLIDAEINKIQALTTKIDEEKITQEKIIWDLLNELKSNRKSALEYQERVTKLKKNIAEITQIGDRFRDELYGQ